MPLFPEHKTAGDTSWFIHDRFGMFIHFGLYALPARHEWVKTNEFISEEKYQKYFDHFDPDLFDAREWAKKAKAAGMKYAVLTTKHHEGFCLFDNKHTDYKITNTPFGRDLVKEYADAFRAEGLHGRLLLFPHRLASSGVPDRFAPSAPQRPERRRA